MNTKIKGEKIEKDFGGMLCSEGALSRETILAEWLHHFNNLAVGETAAPAGLCAGERGGGRNAPAANLLR